LGDSSKARQMLNWKPSVTFPVSLTISYNSFINDVSTILILLYQELVKDMMESDLELMRKNPAA